MTVKESVLSLLEENRGDYLSGEKLAEQLQVTRAAVWKAIRALEGEGCRIEGVPRRGYRLLADTDLLSQEALARLLTLPALAPEVYKTVDSTNTLIRKKALEGAAEGCTALACEQTSGRGRLGRSFYSPCDTGLYMSTLLRPRFPAEKAVLITTAAAVAVCETLEELLGLPAQIKWVNDVFVDEKKVCGILTEAAFGPETGSLDYAVLGIGVNVYRPENGFPAEIENIAGALCAERQCGLRTRIAAGILNRFYGFYENLEKKSFVPEYRRRSLAIGKKVLVVSAENSTPARVLAVDDDCRLLVEYEDGRQEALRSGEISIRLQEP